MSEQIVSRVYKPNPDKCCEACIFGRGEHVEWCAAGGQGTEPFWAPRKFLVELKQSDLARYDVLAVDQANDTALIRRNSHP